MNMKIRYAVAFLAVIALGVAAIERPAGAQKPAGGVPTFQVDPSWPKFDGNWIFGSIGGVFVDPTNDHVWVLNRPRTVAPDENYAAQTPPVADCCVPPPFVMEFDQNGKFLKGWGGPGPGYEWPANEHGLSIDSKGNFWIAANGKGDAHVLKFSRDGKFLLQIGHAGKSAGATIRRTSPRPPRPSTTRRRTRSSCPTATSTGAWPSSMPTRGSTSAIGARTARGPMIRCRAPVPSMARLRSSSISCTTCRFPTTTWSTSPTDRTTASRCSGRMERS